MVFSIVRKTLGWHCKHRAKISIACLPTSALRSGGDKHNCWPFTIRAFNSPRLPMHTIGISTRATGRSMPKRPSGVTRRLATACGAGLVERNAGQRGAVSHRIAVYHVGLIGQHRTARDLHSYAIAYNHGITEVERGAGYADSSSVHERARIGDYGPGARASARMEEESEAGIVLCPHPNQH